VKLSGQAVSPMDEKDTASRKWPLTFDNPAEHGWSHDKIREVLRTFRTVVCWCISEDFFSSGPALLSYPFRCRPLSSRFQ